MKKVDIIAGVLGAVAIAFIILQPDPPPLTPDPVLPHWGETPTDPGYNLAPRAEITFDTLPQFALLNRNFNRLGMSCDVRFFAVDAGENLAQLTLDAPCNSSAPATLVHAGLELQILTSDAGTFQTTVPFLDETARFSIRFEDSTLFETRVVRTDHPFQHHLLLHWDGPAPLELHVFEFGAETGASGHLWLGSRYGKGNIYMMGDFSGIGPRAQIYSLSETSDIEGSVRAHLVLPVTAETCGQDIPVRVGAAEPGAEPEWSDITIVAPDCARIGENLRLKNLFPEIRVRSNS